MTYELKITISNDGYSKVEAKSDMPFFIVDKFKKDAKDIAELLRDTK